MSSYYQDWSWNEQSSCSLGCSTPHSRIRNFELLLFLLFAICSFVVLLLSILFGWRPSWAGLGRQYMLNFISRDNYYSLLLLLPMINFAWLGKGGLIFVSTLIGRGLYKSLLMWARAVGGSFVWRHLAVHTQWMLFKDEKGQSLETTCMHILVHWFDGHCKSWVWMPWWKRPYSIMWTHSSTLLCFSKLLWAWCLSRLFNMYTEATGMEQALQKNLDPVPVMNIRQHQQEILCPQRKHR